MYYPQRFEPQEFRETTEVFRGYNHNLRAGDGEFYDMQNLTSDFFPVLANRRSRGVFKKAGEYTGLIGKDALCYIDGSKFCMNEYRVEMGLNDSPKQLIGMGAYVIILPDRKFINTEDLTDFGNIDAEVTTQGNLVAQLCRADGQVYSPDYMGATEPENPEAMEIWLDTSGEKPSLKQWSGSAAMWVSIQTTYVRLSATGIGKPFSVFDGVQITGLAGLDPELAELESNTVIWAKGDDFIVITGVITQDHTVDTPVTVLRRMPEMDFVVEAKNRLWGCKYGIAEDGQVVNEIYCSKLGDFKNWRCYMGLSTDSWAASVGTDGAFTGAVTHLGYPIFFKENVMHKVYISEIGAHAVQDTACRGVQEGCGASLAIVGETLLYKSRSGICAYDGSLPGDVSAALGQEVYTNAVGGAHGDKYYVSMKDTAGKWHLFVYDLAKGMWHKEDNTQAKAFCSCKGEMYFIDAASGDIMTVMGSGEKQNGIVSWMAETGVIGVPEPDVKYLARLLVRMSLVYGASASFFVEYDSSGNWEYLFTMEGTGLQSFRVPVKVRRCDHLRLRIAGHGEVKIYSVTKIMEYGSDVY